MKSRDLGRDRRRVKESGFYGRHAAILLPRGILGAHEAHISEDDSMRHLTNMDGRPLAFDRKTVIYFEAHESGEGTLVRFVPVDCPLQVHVREDYEAVLNEVTESDIDRAARTFVADAEEPVPF